MGRLKGRVLCGLLRETGGMLNFACRGINISFMQVTVTNTGSKKSTAVGKETEIIEW